MSHRQTSRPNLFSRWWSKAFATGRRTQLAHFRPQLECLEDRITPSVTVTTTLDPATPIVGQLSLREAIAEVNAGQVADNTIILPGGTYQNTQGALNVTHSLILQGAGAGNTILDGDGMDRVVLIDPAAMANVQLSGVTVRNGNTTGSGGGIDVTDVGGQSSVLTVQNCTITGNTAGNGGNGGGIFANNGDINVINSQLLNNTAGALGFGGGIADFGGGTGNVTVTNSLIAGNSAGSAGGGIGLLEGGPGALTVTGSTISNNSLTTANFGGGGIFANTTGVIRVTNTTIQGNTSLTDGGGFVDQFAVPTSLTFSNDTIDNNQSTQGNGGGIAVLAASNVSIQDSTLSGNTAGLAGAGLFLGNTVLTTTLQGSTVSGNTAGTFGGGVEDEALTLMATNSIISNNLVRNGDGGGIDDMTNGTNQMLSLTNVSFIGNSAGGNVLSGVGFGGGLYDSNTTSTVTVVSCLFANNMSSSRGAGIEQAEGALTVRASQFTGNNAANNGGAIDFNAAMPLTVSESTFNNNQSGFFGGALEFNRGAGTSSLTNDTFVSNTALAAGGAIDTVNGLLALVNDTINGNTAGSNGGGISDEASGTYRFQNTIVAGNTAAVFAVGGQGPDVFVNSALNITDNGGNFIGNLSGSSGFGPGTRTGNPLLGPLADNGGRLAGANGDQQVVQTEALLQNSPAIGKGVANGAPNTDERGFPRLPPPDIGASQFQNAALQVTVTPAAPGVFVNGNDSFTVTVRNTGGTALPADNSTLTVSLSAGLTPTSPLTFTLTAIPAGQSQTFTVTATATTLGTQTITATVASVDANPVIGNATVNVVTLPPAPPPTTLHTPQGALTPFAFGFGPTGIDLFEIDSVGDIFAQAFMGGGALLFLNTALHLPLAALQNGQLLALLAGGNGQNFLIDVFNPFIPSVEPAVIAAFLHR
ncbi:MAG TPA: right-handed parallel beta-helix repeat-containing protein [Gemmataceae bacterium]|nr:right-handed parallel beta-helix repeat-containing protein [Gemmataceae bacterium]